LPRILARKIFHKIDYNLSFFAADGHFYGSRGSDLNIEISFPLAENYGRSAR
jgi:hypothetical protein